MNELLEYYYINEDDARYLFKHYNFIPKLRNGVLYCECGWSIHMGNVVRMINAAKRGDTCNSHGPVTHNQLMQINSRMSQLGLKVRDVGYQCVKIDHMWISHKTINKYTDEQLVQYVKGKS